MTTSLKTRLAQTLLAHGIMAGAELLTDLEQAVSGQKQDVETEVWKLIELFCELKHQPAPQPKTAKEHKAVQAMYIAPMREIVRCANGQAADVVKRTVEKMRRDGLTCGYPKQLVTCALSMADEMQADSKDATAWDVWAALCSFVSERMEEGWQIGWIEKPEWINGRVAQAVDAIGWKEICEGGEYTRAHFVRAYEKAI